MPPTAPSPHEEEAKFISDFVDKQAAAAEAEPEAPAAKPDAEEPVADEPEGEEQHGEKPEEDSEADKPAEEPEGDEEPEGEKPADEPEGDKPADEPEDENEKEPDGPASKETLDALTKHGLKLKLEDIPAAARPIVERKLQHMDAAFTRAMQEAREYRGRIRETEAERRFTEEHPELYLAEQFYKLSPEGRDELIGKVQEQIDRFADKDKAKLFEIETKEGRDAARRAVNEQHTQVERQMQRADEISVYARTASRRLGLPWEHVENAVVVALAGKPEGKRDLTEAELDQIIDAQARIAKRHSVKVIREDKRSSIRSRTKDRANTTPASRIGGSQAPAGGAKPKMPANDAEFTEHMMEKLGSGKK